MAQYPNENEANTGLLKSEKGENLVHQLRGFMSSGNRREGKKSVFNEQGQ